MRFRKVNVLENVQLENSDDMHAVVGQMALQLLKTGQPLQAQNMVAFLHQQADQTANCPYTLAISAIADRVR